jgi:predicted component of type VI protein secretion system
MPYLENDGVRHELPPGDTLVGSASDANWRLQTINLAPRHFTVNVDGAGAVVLTPHQAHDVDVNGETLTGAHVLRHGDEIIAGAGIFTFLDAPDGAGATAAASGAAAYLIDIRGGLAYALTDEPVTIGRDPLNQIAVRDPSVSRFHAEIRTTPDKRAFTVRSMGAAGSSVNGALVGGNPRQLAEGDLVRISGTTLRFTTLAPPPIMRIVTRADVPAAGMRSRQSGALQSAVEAPTLGSYEPGASKSSGSGSLGPWVTAALLTTGALLALLILRALHSH